MFMRKFFVFVFFNLFVISVTSAASKSIQKNVGYSNLEIGLQKATEGFQDKLLKALGEVRKAKRELQEKAAEQELARRALLIAEEELIIAQGNDDGSREAEMVIKTAERELRIAKQKFRNAVQAYEIGTAKLIRAEEKYEKALQGA
ncbi:MAG: hypothetical protein Sapg2KO_21940 [Saprospiraceae bacterium]